LPQFKIGWQMKNIGEQTGLGGENRLWFIES